MNRRNFAAALALATLGAIPIGRSGWAATVPTAGPARQKKLVVVFLRGAADGLSIVAPYSEPSYARGRPTIALPAPGADDALIDLDGHFGLHPALRPLMPHWTAGTMGFVHASGSPDATRSHFEAQDAMESGASDVKRSTDGWINRLLTDLPGAPSPTRGVSLGAVLPRICRGAFPVASIAQGPAATRPMLLDEPPVADAFARLYDGDDAIARTFRESRAARRDVMASLDGAERERIAADNGAPLPNGFPGDAARLARLMRSDATMQIAFVALGGWDTHAGQGGARGQLANRLAPLATGLAVLAERLGSTFDDTVVVVISEFGRTMRENGNRGTDHGHGNVLWLLGGPVAGGRVHGRWPGVDDASLNDGRDLAITTDYRDVVADIAARHLGLSDARLAHLFPGSGEQRRELRVVRR